MHSPEPEHVAAAHHHLAHLVGQPSWSSSPDDLAQCADRVADLFADVSDTVEVVELDPIRRVDDDGAVRSQRVGPAVRALRRPDAAKRVLLVGHYDTVFAPDVDFHGIVDDGEVQRGPGVIDAKGGLVVLWLGLIGFELDADPDVGWEILVVGDEEIGSPGSTPLLAEAAGRAHIGFVYEPAAADGGMVGPRPGSVNLTHVVRGRSAHAGRDLAAGRNALVAAGRLAERIHDLAEPPSRLANPGVLRSGTTANIVPDLAVLRSNLRAVDGATLDELEQRVSDFAAEFAVDGLTIETHVTSRRAPKELSERYRRLLDEVIATAAGIGLTFGWQPSGGVCDGNVLAGAGLANVDSLGPVGGDLHRTSEWLVPGSIAERARLTTALLRGVAEGTVGG